MKNLKLAQDFYNKYKNIDILRIGDLFNLCLLILEERKIIDIKILASLKETQKIYEEILKNKKFEYLEKKLINMYNKETIRYSCTLKKNKHILKKINKEPFDDKLYAKYLDTNFYRCKLNKNSEYFIIMNANFIKNKKYYTAMVMSQTCTLKDVQKNMKEIFTHIRKFEKITKILSPELTITFVIQPIDKNRVT